MIIFCSVNSALPSGVLEAKFTVRFLPKYGFFSKRQKELFVVAHAHFATIKNIFRIIFSAKFLRLGIFRTTKAKRTKFK